MSLQIVHSKHDPLDVSVQHHGNVIPLHVRAPHIREVKAALLTIKEYTKDTQVYAEAVQVLERFIYTR